MIRIEVVRRLQPDHIIKVGKGSETGWSCHDNSDGTLGRNNSSHCCWLELRKSMHIAV